jgi:hypothetical protein
MFSPTDPVGTVMLLLRASLQATSYGNSIHTLQVPAVMVTPQATPAMIAARTLPWLTAPLL